MEKGCSVPFLTTLVRVLQQSCQNSLNFSQFVEVTGYINVEMDNLKKERYVLSELLQSSGNVVSESFCVKAFNTVEDVGQMDSVFQPNRPQSVDTACQDREWSPQLEPDQNDPLSVDAARTDREWSPQLEMDPGNPRKQSLSDASSRSYNKQSRNLEETRFESMTLPVVQDPTPSFLTNPVTLESKVTPTHLQSQSQWFSPQQDSLQDARPMASTSTESDEPIDLDTYDDDDPECIILNDENSPHGDAEETWPSSSQRSEDQSQSGNCNSSQQRKTQLSPGSLSAIKHSVKQFKKFHFDKSGIDVDLLVTPPERLNELLLEYFSQARKYNIAERTYSILAARTLKNVRAHLEMYLRDGGYPHSISKDIQFKSARDFLKRKMEESGKIVAQKHDPVDDHDIEVLFGRHLLGIKTPESLSNTMWFLNSRYFAIRRPAEHFNLKWGDISLKVDDNGHEYLDRHINKSFSLKLFANLDKPDRCFVTLYKHYKAVRPKVAHDPDYAFYVKVSRIHDGHTWFLPEPMPWSALSGLWRRIVVAAGLPLNKKIF